MSVPAQCARKRQVSYTATPSTRLNPALPFGVMFTTRERGVRSTQPFAHIEIQQARAQRARQVRRRWVRSTQPRQNARRPLCSPPVIDVQRGQLFPAQPRGLEFLPAGRPASAP